jgi:hypothetical protein
MTDRRAAFLPDQRLLILHVDSELVDAIAHGERESFRVWWTPGAGWRCSCPAISSACGHIGAVRAVVVVEALPAETVGDVMSSDCADSLH